MTSLAGQLLVAAPDLVDPNFRRSVVLIVRHDDEGALGLILNRVTGTQVREAWRQVSESTCLREDVLRQGGPCQGPLMLLHDDPEASLIEVVPGLHFSWDLDHAERLVTSTDGQARFFVGHAGWAPGQLEGELGTGSWMTIEALATDAFAEAADTWAVVRRRIGHAEAKRRIDPGLVPEDPAHN